MSDKRDYYETLGVSKDAADSEIKRAYRRLAMKHHPDRNPGDETAAHRFKEVQEAYAVLSDTEQRARYDRFGHAGVEGGGGRGGFGGFEDISDIFGEFFEEMFRGGRGSSGPQPGSDLGCSVHITLEEAVFGTSHDLEVPTWESCEKCDGSGAKKGTKPTRCKTCHGRGQVQMRHGFIAVQQTCGHCHGSGQEIENPCRTCRGEGRIQTKRKLSIKIPAGIDHGDRIRLAGKGEAGQQGAPAGDLYVEVQVAPHAIFTRRGNDLHCDVPISFVTAALGGEVEIPTLKGHATIKIPAETQTGKSFRLRGKGVKALRSGQVGDLLCQVVVETPVNLSEQQKEHLRAFDVSLHEDKQGHSPKATRWFDSVKQFFRQTS